MGSIALSLPHLIFSIKRGHLETSLFGINEGITRARYTALGKKTTPSKTTKAQLKTKRSRIVQVWNSIVGLVKALGFWTPPLLDLNLGQGVSLSLIK